jgi:hypothetical protein
MGMSSLLTRKVENKAKTSRPRKTPKLSVFDPVCMCQRMGSLRRVYPFVST